MGGGGRPLLAWLQKTADNHRTLAFSTREEFIGLFRKSLTVLDFRQNSSRLTGQSRRDRHRIVMLFLMMGFIFLVAEKARDPSIWRLLDRIVSPTQGIILENAVDNRLEGGDPPSGLDEDAFSVAEERIARQESSKLVAGYFPGIAPEDFEGVRDDRPSMRSEVACSMRLLDILRRTDARTLRDASVGRVTYAQLFRQPDDFRGRLVTVSGVVRRAHWIAVAKNDYGIQEYCQLWLWPTDNPASPMILYCLQLPKGFPTGMDVAADVELTGFFFKRCAYPSQDAVRTAPEILAKNVQWIERPVLAPKEPVKVWPAWMLIIVAGVLAAAAAMLVYFRTQSAPSDLPNRLPPFRNGNESEAERETGK